MQSRALPGECIQSPSSIVEGPPRAIRMRDGSRTRTLSLWRRVLYQLSYAHEKTPACRSRGRGRVVERAWLGREPTTRTGYHPGNVPPSRGGTCTTTGDLLRASSLRLLNG